MKKIDFFILSLFIFLVFIFLYYSQIDIKVSSFFYKNNFYLANCFIVKFIYQATRVIIALFSISTVFLLILDLVFKKDFFHIRKKALVYLLITLILGPGLIVNTLLKDNFGRARPSQIKEFGGNKNFTPAFVISNQCKKNCSFTSGHAAAAFYFLALVPLFRRRKTQICIASLALFWGSLVGFIRIIQGGHFLSDVVFSAFIIYFTAKISYYLVFKEDA